MSPKEGRTMKRIGLLVACILYACVVMVVPVEVEAGTITVRADGTGDYPTIQAAINAANPGDEVVLERGTYAGCGNHNLDFNAKAITVRSQNPENNICMRKTIIDANGQGVIVRFINDEGPGSVFEGFTLGAGDTSKGVRGLPGFFEFSQNARPTTRRLRNKKTEDFDSSTTLADEVLLSEFYDPNLPGWVPPLGGRVWSGYNPFHQPAATTDYYGSGDADNDGDLTSADVSLAQDMADGIEEPVTRADVDGDGDVDSDDVWLINNVLSGGTLASWWNTLTSVTERNNWIDKVIVIERTDERWYDNDFFVCHHFAYQTFIHCNYLRGDFATGSTEYDGGQTVFNVPLYWVSVGSPTNHAINAILVGDDPLNFNDWRFIEPQNDTDVVPGQWNMLYGSSVRISTQVLHGNPERMVTFYVDESGWSLSGHSDNLITSRPIPVVEPPDNRPDLWNPRILSVGSGQMLYEQMREDMFRITDIHLTDLPFADPPLGIPLILDDQFCRLLDVTTGPDDTIHLLWEGLDVFYQQTLFHGTLEPVGNTVNNVTHITPGQLRLAASGRIVVTPYNDIHVFWFENLGYAGSYDLGIHWTKWNGTVWQAPQLLTSDIPQSAGADWLNRNFALYIYDVEVLDNDDIILVWSEKIFPSFYISQLIYDGTWSSSQIEDTGWSNSLRGVDLCKDSDGNLHLAYWRGDRQQPAGIEEGRGDLYHRTFDGVSWSSPIVVDNSGGVCCPRIAPGVDGAVYMAWERKVGDSVVPMYAKYADGGWLSPKELSVRPDANAWYPIVGRLPNGKVLVAWSSRSDDRVTIEMQVVEPAPPEAQSDTVESQLGAPVMVELKAVDDGLPNPPGVLTYIICSLPTHGLLDDPQAGPINTVPYTLANYGNQVECTPDINYVGQDSFTFIANDGGTAPDGGDSNIGTITIEVSNCTDITIGTGTSTWDYPMHTWFHDSRTQVIYLSSEIGMGGSITALGLDVATQPGQTMNNWTIRMKNTTMSTYTTASLDATGWTIVYEGNEPPGGTGWRTFEFSTPFDYNDTNNLLVDFSHNNNSYTTNGECMCSTPGGTRSAYARTDSVYGNPLDWSGTSLPAVYAIDKVPNVRLTICGDGGPMCVVNFEDFANFAANWQRTDCDQSNNWCNGADLNQKDGVNLADMADFANEWLCYCPYDWPLK